MHRIRVKNIVLFVIFFLNAFCSQGQIIKEPTTKAEWLKPFPPFRIAGNLYYVGTYDLGCYLIVTAKGNILINTGMASSAAQIRKNIETLGFKYSDLNILLITQAHFDHTGALAEIKAQTHATFMADEKEVDVLASGGSTDYELGKYGTSFKPVKVDALLHDGDTITLGDTQLVLLHHPGHTKGSCSYLFTVKDEQWSYRVLIANMPSIITEKHFADIPAYPSIAQDYAKTLQDMKAIEFDIWVASHASQVNLHDKHKPGNMYKPLAFADQEGYLSALDDLQKEYDKKLKKDAEKKF
ncbi:MAG: subclass B3 metallo-beta-lactamase [Ginsengibacter sp.]